MNKILKITFLIIYTFTQAIGVYGQCFEEELNSDAPNWDYGKTIEQNYNDARRWEETNLGLTANCLGNMVEPSVGWAGMNEESTALYIHNSEREARGKLPLYDVESNLDNVAQTHSQWQIDNGVFSHGGDPALGSDGSYKLCSDCNTSNTGSDPFERINHDPPLKDNADWKNENIGIRVTSGSSLADFVPERIYAFIYRDAGSGWGHRNTVFYDFNNDWGDANTEGFIGVGLADGTDFDICQFGCDDNWNLARILTIDYYDPKGSASGFTFKGLPIRLLSFDAKAKGDEIYISWSTMSETNNDYFLVEKSPDGVDFEELSKINSKGDSKSLQEYSCIDQNPYNGINYFRLKQVDFDGKSQYSKIISVVVEQSDFAAISPNPFNDYVVVNSNFSQENNKIQIIDIKGNVVYNSTLPTGKNNTKIYLPGLKSGIYFMKIYNSNFKKTLKLIKI